MHGGEQVRAGGERFDVRVRLGSGGGGVVFRAYDRQRRQEVALKLLHRRDHDERTAFRARFSHLRALSHPNLVQLHELIEERDQSLLVMELVEGVDLLAYVRRASDAFDELRVRAAFGQLAQALSALHRARHVHRDVKPENVRVTSAGRVVLLDLDLALDLDVERSERLLGKPQKPVGTAAYIAPEQAAGLRLSPACDWYGMGVVLYEALTGVRPHSGPDLAVLLDKQESRPVPPSELVEGLPRDLASLCVDLLTPEPSERPTGAAIFQRLGVHEDLLSARWSAASLLSARPSFVGRERELMQIEQALVRSRSAAVVVRVTAHSGLGKTSLCEEARARLTQADAELLALSSACPRYPEQPHAALHEPIAQLAQALRASRNPIRISASALRLLERAFPGAVVGIEAKVQGRTALAPDPLEQRWRAIAAVRSLLSELAAQRPVLLWLDDYHWADVDTKRLVSALVQGPDAPRLLLLLSEEPEPGLAPSALPRTDETIALSKLSTVEAKQLTDALLAHAGQLRSTLETAPHDERSPLLIQERVRQALLFSDELVTASFPALIRRRVGALPTASRGLLELVCAAFDALPQVICERASELAPAAFTRHVAELTMDGLVRHVLVRGEDAIAPSHPLIAELVDLELIGEARVRTHRKLAAALVAHDAARASGRLLRHQGESGEHERAAESAELAAEQAHAALAFQRAAELFSLRASLQPPTPDRAGYRLLRRMADALAHAGWALSAATVYREAALFADSADALQMRQRSLEHLFRGAEIAEGRQASFELLGTLDALPGPSVERALWSLRRQRLHMRVWGLGFREQSAQSLPETALHRVDALFGCAVQLSRVDAVLGAELSLRALSAARALGEPLRVARALCVEAWNFVGHKTVDTERSERLLESARAISERYDAPLLDGHLRLARGMLALSRHDVRAASLHCRDAERVFRDSCADTLWEQSTAQVHKLFALSCMADYRELGAELEHYRREADERGDVWTYTALLGIDALGAALAGSSPELSRERLREATSRWGEHEVLHAQPIFGLFASTAIDLYERSEGVHEELERRLERVEHFARIPFVRIAVAELRARAKIAAAIARSDSSLLRRGEADARSLRGERAAAPLGFGQLLLANVHAYNGARAAAIAGLERGLRALEPLGLSQWTLPAQVALGRLQGTPQGRSLANEARAQLAAQGVSDVDRFVSMMLPAFAFE
jgi:eukaryotic-like serine/threonine-protein kinase